MTDKQIMIDGVKYNPCNDCELWNGHHCIGARSYEPNANEHKAICNEHMAKQFYKVYQQLYRKTQECEELKKELNGSEKWRIKAESLNEKLELRNTCYRKALEEIEEHYEKVVKNLTTYDDSYDANISIEALHNISDIINKAKGEGDE